MQIYDIRYCALTLLFASKPKVKIWVKIKRRLLKKKGVLFQPL